MREQRIIDRNTLRRIVLGGLLASLVLFGTLHAQVSIRPQVGIQTLWFNQLYPVNSPISPAPTDLTTSLGGGMTGNHFGPHLAVEIIPSPDDIIRYPIVAEAFFLTGATTFAVSPITDPLKQRITFTHTGAIYSFGTGVTASFFKLPSLYVSLTGRVNYIPHTTLNFRQFYSKSNETISEREVVVDSTNNLRFGLYFQVGTQVKFIEPFLVDFSAGFGIINLAGKDTNPATQRNLMIVDPTAHDQEQTLTYVGVGMSVVWKQ